MSATKQTLFLPPTFRFLMELTTWVYFIILAFQSEVLYIFGFLASAFCLAVFNFPGDKKQDGPVNIPGYARILNEWISGCLLGMVGAYLLFQEIGLALQIILILLVIIFDRERYFWMLGMRESAPDYVKIIHEY